MSNSDLRTYETIVVFNPTLGENDVKEWSKKVQTFITSNNGEKVTVDPWGRKELPYLVSKFQQGYFVRFKYDSVDSSLVGNLTNQLRIAEPVIKFQSHKLNNRVRKFKGNPKKPKSSDASDDNFDID